MRHILNIKMKLKSMPDEHQLSFDEIKRMEDELTIYLDYKNTTCM